MSGTKSTIGYNLYILYKRQKAAILAVQKVHTPLRECTLYRHGEQEILA